MLCFLTVIWSFCWREMSLAECHLVTSAADLLIKAEQKPALSLWLPSDKLEIKSCFC